MSALLLYYEGSMIANQLYRSCQHSEWRHQQLRHAYRQGLRLRYAANHADADSVRDHHRLDHLRLRVCKQVRAGQLAHTPHGARHAAHGRRVRHDGVVPAQRQGGASCRLLDDG